MILSKNLLERNNIELIAQDEEFKQVRGWRNYFISNHGRLLHKNNKNKYKIVNPSITNGGYLTYTLSRPARKYRGETVRDKHGNAKTVRKCKPAHVLVAMMYVDHDYPDNYRIEELDVHHKDKKRDNNYYKNLMYLNSEHHGFIHTIKKISLYNQKTTQFHTYKDIELLAKRIDTDVLELLDALKYNEKLFKSQDGKWDVYNINGCFIGVIYFSNSN